MKAVIYKLCAACLLACAAMLSGCLPLIGSHTTMSHTPLSNVREYVIRISQTGAAMTANAHGIGPTVHVHELWLSSGPKGDRTVYRANALLVVEGTSRGKAAVTLKGGTVTIDLAEKKALVDLDTYSGPFAGNGEYSLELHPSIRAAATSNVQ